MNKKQFKKELAAVKKVVENVDAFVYQYDKEATREIDVALIRCAAMREAAMKAPLEIAGYMLDKGYPIKEIADMVKLPQKEIKEIASKKTVCKKRLL